MDAMLIGFEAMMTRSIRQMKNTTCRRPQKAHAQLGVPRAMTA
jgi:hypothetical protein